MGRGRFVSEAHAWDPHRWLPVTGGAPSDHTDRVPTLCRRSHPYAAARARELSDSAHVCTNESFPVGSLTASTGATHRASVLSLASALSL